MTPHLAPRNGVLLVLGLVALAAIAFGGFVSHAPNRLVSGEPVALWQAARAPEAIAIVVLSAALAAASFLPPARALHGAAALAATILLLLVLDAAGEAARALAAPSHPAARTSLGAAAWTVGLAAVLALVDAVQRLRAGAALRIVAVAVIAGLVAALIAGGRLDGLSMLREYDVRHGAFAEALLRHGALVLGALLPALVIGVPLGVVAARQPALRAPLFAGLNFVQTVPSIALFGLLIAALSALAAAWPPLGALGLRGIGVAPAIIALVLYALLPIVRNTSAGIGGVDPAAIEAARGMGFTGAQIFWRVELPLALPVFLAGLRIVTVQTIGLAVVAALIGAGGLGTFVFQGLGQYALGLVLLGAVPAILLALAADFVLRIAVDLATTEGRIRDRAA